MLWKKQLPAVHEIYLGKAPEKLLIKVKNILRSLFISLPV